jgi:thioredoxin-related protein
VPPPEELQTLLGEPVQFADAQISAKYVLVVYWKQSCEWCMKFLPVIDRLNRYNIYFNFSLGYMFINAVAINVEDTTDDVAMIMGRNGLSFTSWVGGEMPENASGTPFTEIYVDGALVGEIVGYMDYETLSDMIVEIIYNSQPTLV